MHHEFDFLRSFFSNNGFPSFLIDSEISRFLNSKFQPSPTILTASKQQLYLSFPFFGQQSEKLIKELTDILSKHFYAINFNFIPVNNFKISSLFHFKDNLPGCLRSSVVYRFRCVHCTSGYVGYTSRTLKTRIAEHLGRSFRTGRPLSCPAHSSIRLHSERCDHTVSPDNFNILISAKSTLDLRILESIHILKLKPDLNDMQSSFPLQILNH